MRHLAAVRRTLAVPTVMNLVGPLANPARVTRQVIGVAEPALGPVMAGALVRLGCVHGLVVHGEIGLDEIAPVGRTPCWEVLGGGVTARMIDPASVGLAAPDLLGTEGGSPTENAQAIARLLHDPSGAPRALRNAVLLNAAAGILVSGVVSGFAEAAALATVSLDEGRAADRLEALRQVSPFRTSE
jgi:anthranilate phosphoribosyltransferase